MSYLNPILVQEITRIINSKSPLQDRPTNVEGSSIAYVGGILPDRATHLIAFHVEGWGLHRWASFTFQVAGLDPLNMSIQNLTYRPEMTMPGATPFDEEDLTALASKLLYV